MVTVRFFMARPVGYTSRNYALGRNSVAELLDACIFTTPDADRAKREDFDGEASIIECSGFSNGARATVEVAPWVIYSLCKRRELSQLEIGDDTLTFDKSKGCWYKETGQYDRAYFDAAGRLQNA